MIENKLVRETQKEIAKKHKKNKKFREKHKCDKSNFLTSSIIYCYQLVTHKEGLSLNGHDKGPMLQF